MRSEKALRSLCRRELSDLSLDLPLDAEQLCRLYGEKRGRAIKIIAHPLPAGMPNGVWMMADDADYFFYQSSTTKLHRDQIVIHEFGHLIAGHQIPGADPVMSIRGALATAGQGDDEPIEEALRRTCYSDDREWEAEMVATIIGDWAATAAQGVGKSADHGGLRGIQSMLGGHSGWL